MGNTMEMRNLLEALPEKEKKRVDELEKKIIGILQGESDIEICALLSILNKKLKQ